MEEALSTTEEKELNITLYPIVDGNIVLDSGIFPEQGFLEKIRSVLFFNTRHPHLSSYLYNFLFRWIMPEPPALFEAFQHHKVTRSDKMTPLTEVQTVSDMKNNKRKLKYQVFTTNTLGSWALVASVSLYETYEEIRQRKLGPILNLDHRDGPVSARFCGDGVVFWQTSRDYPGGYVLYFVDLSAATDQINSIRVTKRVYCCPPGSSYPLLKLDSATGAIIIYDKDKKDQNMITIPLDFRLMPSHHSDGIPRWAVVPR